MEQPLPDVLYSHAVTGSFCVKQKMLRKISAYRGKDISGQLRTLLNYELHDLYK
jgi:hypothetical protein